MWLTPIFHTGITAGFNNFLSVRLPRLAPPFNVYFKREHCDRQTRFLTTPSAVTPHSHPLQICGSFLRDSFAIFSQSHKSQNATLCPQPQFTSTRLSLSTSKMPDKLSQSLDQIMSDRRKSTRKTRPRPGAKASVAPTGGVTKKTKPAEKKPQGKAVPTGPSNKESKVQVSNLVSCCHRHRCRDGSTNIVPAS